MAAYFENEFGMFRIEDRILFLSCRENTILELQSAYSLAQYRMQLQQCRYYPVLFDITNIAGSTKEGRDFLFGSGWFFASTVAIVATTPKSAALACFLRSIALPVPSVHFFSDPATAVIYLATHR